MSKHRFSLLFRLRKPKNHTGGTVPVYMCITIDAIRIELSTNREVDPSRWNAILGRSSGKKEDALTLNAYLDTLQVKVYEAHREILAAKDVPIVEKIKNIITGRNVERPRMLLEIFSDHNNQMDKLIENEEYAKGTLTHFGTTLSHTKSFIQWKYSISEIIIDKVDCLVLKKPYSFCW